MNTRVRIKRDNPFVSSLEGCCRGGCHGDETIGQRLCAEKVFERVRQKMSDLVKTIEGIRRTSMESQPSSKTKPGSSTSNQPSFETKSESSTSAQIRREAQIVPSSSVPSSAL
ncbi:hypothetical protein V6N13_073939 [Hibiscus sabdariffa]|uniref:Uncharacterized protein n=1 Tax=Hibiscus sabdariffa TaxID=183260 RepID=A0ABR2U7U2_9ROSI